MRIFVQREISPEMVDAAQDWPHLSRAVEGQAWAVLVRDARQAGWDGSPVTVQMSWWVETSTAFPDGVVTSVWDPTLAQPADAVAYLCRVEMNMPVK